MSKKEVTQQDASKLKPSNDNRKPVKAKDVRIFLGDIEVEGFSGMEVKGFIDGRYTEAG